MEGQACYQWSNPSDLHTLYALMHAHWPATDALVNHLLQRRPEAVIYEHESEHAHANACFRIAMVMWLAGDALRSWEHAGCRLVSVETEIGTNWWCVSNTATIRLNEKRSRIFRSMTLDSDSSFQLRLLLFFIITLSSTLCLHDHAPLCLVSLDLRQQL